MLNIIFAMVVISGSFANFPYDIYAENEHQHVTPYGEKCPLCGDYGYCTEQPTYGEAMTALKSYYGKKGLAVIILRPRDRFLEFGVYRNGSLVDRVLLDLRTGRMRSMY